MKNRNFIFCLLIFSIAFTVLSFLYIKKRSELLITNKQLKKQSSLSSYMNSKFEIEGKYLWDINLINKEEYASFLFKKDEYKIIVWFDSVGCPKCYNFHVRNIMSKIGLKNILVLYNQLKYIRKDYFGAAFYYAFRNNCKYKQLILLVNSDGKILYADFPQFKQLELSEKFYNIISSYTKKI